MGHDKTTTGRDPIGWARLRASAALLTEAVWPTVFGWLVLVGAFFCLAWFGIFAGIGDIGRLLLLGGLALAALVLLWRARGVRWPSPAAVERRIETASRLDHRPLGAQSDRPVESDPFAQALWREHQKRMAERLKGLAGGAPRTRTERLDPLGLRAALAILVMTAFAYSYGTSGGRVADAFAAPAAETLLAARVDAWVTPPSYTGRAPIFLTDLAAGEAPPASIEVPQGSVLSVRVSDGSGVTLTLAPTDGSAPVQIAPVGAAEAAKEPTPASEATARLGAPAVGEYEVPLKANATASLATTFRTLGNWSFQVTPDRAPSIALVGEPSTARNGALELAYGVDDDYGVAKGRAEITVTDGVAPGARPLVPVPEVNLAMPRRTKGEAKGRTNTDLTQSPYAGADVSLRLVAVDDAGQEGRSDAKAFTLPERRFTNPLARAVVEQRRILALDANASHRVVEMLDAVTMRDGEFIEKGADYLALRAVRTRIATATGDEALLSSVDFLWQIALGIEDGNLSLAEKALRDAREKLAEALEKGASEAEIDKLMADLRQAMRDYMQAMAEAMKSMPPMSQEQMQAGNMQELRPQDLDKMLDRIEDLAKSGSKDAAKELLSELQRMMDNMQAMKPGQPQESGEQNAMRQQMDKLGEMLRRQQELKDKTFSLGREQMRREDQEAFGEPEPGTPQDGQPQDGQSQAGEGGQGAPMTAEQLRQAMKDLEAQQGQLQKELQAMQDAMKGMGLQPGKGFGEAGDAMGKAQGALGQGDDGEAVGQQGQAMEAMRRGAQDMMKQMQAMQGGQGQPGQPGQQGQPGQSQMGQGYGRGEQRSGRDPLGRPRSTEGMDFGQDVRVPDEIDTQRARRILDSIRNRLGNALSPQLEREYLERLLKAQ